MDQSELLNVNEYNLQLLSSNDFIVNINIVQIGLCKRNNSIVFWGLIPKVDDSANVQFTIVKK